MFTNKMSEGKEHGWIYRQLQDFIMIDSYTMKNREMSNKIIEYFDEIEKGKQEEQQDDKQDDGWDDRQNNKQNDKQNNIYNIINGVDNNCHNNMQRSFVDWSDKLLVDNRYKTYLHEKICIFAIYDEYDECKKYYDYFNKYSKIYIFLIIYSLLYLVATILLYITMFIEENIYVMVLYIIFIVIFFIGICLGIYVAQLYYKKKYDNDILIKSSNDSGNDHITIDDFLEYHKNELLEKYRKIFSIEESKVTENSPKNMNSEKFKQNENVIEIKQDKNKLEEINKKQDTLDEKINKKQNTLEDNKQNKDRQKNENISEIETKYQAVLDKNSGINNMMKNDLCNTIVYVDDDNKEDLHSRSFTRQQYILHRYVCEYKQFFIEIDSYISNREKYLDELIPYSIFLYIFIPLISFSYYLNKYHDMYKFDDIYYILLVLNSIFGIRFVQYVFSLMIKNSTNVKEEVDNTLAQPGVCDCCSCILSCFCGDC